MRKQIMVLAVTLAGCANQGYWPKVDGDMGAKYQSDVRECQTVTQSQGAYALGGLYGAVVASDSESGRARIDACMAQKGYRVSKTE